MDRSADDSEPPVRPGSSYAPRSEQGSREENPVFVRAAPAASAVAPRRSQSSTQGRRRTFPFRLHALLSDVEKTGQTHIISWQPHGRCFIVRNTDAFVEQLLPRYFSQTKWSSFQRQLNLYSFERISAGVDRGGYHHRFFLRGEPALCEAIKRSEVKGTRIRVPSDVAKEPNFWLQQPVNPPMPGPLAGLEHLLYPLLSMQIHPTASSSIALSVASTPSANPTDQLLLQSLAMANPQILAGLNDSTTNQTLLMIQSGLQPDALASLPASDIDRMRQLIGTNRSSTNTAATAEASGNNVVNLNLVDQILASIPGDIQSSDVVRLPDRSSPEAHRFLVSGYGAVSEGTTTNDSSNDTEAEDDNLDSKPAAVENPNQKDDSHAEASGVILTTHVGNGVAPAVPSVASVDQPTPNTSNYTKPPTESDTPNELDQAGYTASEGDIDESSEWGRFLNRYFD